MRWCVYLIITKRGTLYCGATNDIERRYKQHCSGKGAKYLRANRPERIVWMSHQMPKVEALKLEVLIKKFSRTRKDKLIAGDITIKVEE